MNRTLGLAIIAAVTALPSLAQQVPPGPLTDPAPPSGAAPATTIDRSGTLDLTGDVRRPRNDNEDFLNAVATEFPDVALARPTSDLDRTVLQGGIIAATLETRLISDLPGLLRAIVNQDVRSFDGSQVLIPKGSRLIGTYRADLRINQARVLILWSRLITPDGLSIMIGSPGADRLGSAGQTGEVNTHFRTRFGSAALISVIGVAPTVAAASASENDATSELIGNIGTDFQDATSSVVGEYLDIPPTIQVNQGAQLNVIVNRDLVFPFLD